MHGDVADADDMTYAAVVTARGCIDGHVGVACTPKRRQTDWRHKARPQEFDVARAGAAAVD